MDLDGRHAAASERPGLSRRQMLKRGAVVGATAAWTVPLIQVVSMTPAHADTPSSPVVPPAKPPVVPPVTPPPTAPSTHPSSSQHTSAPPDDAPTTHTTTTPANQHSAASAPAAAPVAKPAADVPAASGQLASTGGALPVGPTLGVAGAAVAAGVAALAAAHVMGEKDKGSDAAQE